MSSAGCASGHLSESNELHYPVTSRRSRTLYLACGTDFELALDIKDPAAIEGVVDMAKRYGATDRLWVLPPRLASRRVVAGRSIPTSNWSTRPGCAR